MDRIAGNIVPSFATFSPGLPNNVQATVLPVSGPPRVDTKSSGMAKVLPCNAGKSAQKAGTILVIESKDAQ